MHNCKILEKAGLIRRGATFNELEAPLQRESSVSNILILGGKLQENFACF
jgi:hypothetical protein